MSVPDHCLAFNFTDIADRNVKFGNNTKGNDHVNSTNHRNVSRGTNQSKTYSNMDRARKEQPKRTHHGNSSV